MQRPTTRRTYGLLSLGAALSLLSAGGCQTFADYATAAWINNVPRTVFNSALQIVISILNGTSNFLFQSGGQFGGGFGS
jgi:hypothetical protein